MFCEFQCASNVSAAPQSEYTLSDCCSSSAPGGSAQGPSSRLAAAGDSIFTCTYSFMNNHLDFRLHSLSISGHPVLRDVQIVFCDDIDTYENVYDPVIIDANLTAKSQFVFSLAEKDTNAVKG